MVVLLCRDLEVAHTSAETGCKSLAFVPVPSSPSSQRDTGACAQSEWDDSPDITAAHLLIYLFSWLVGWALFPL